MRKATGGSKVKKFAKPLDSARIFWHTKETDQKEEIPMTSPAAQTASQPSRSELIRPNLGLRPQPLTSNSDRLEQLTILMEEIKDSGDATALFQIAKMAMDRGTQIVGC